jgi:hypothetical protein
MQPASQKLLRLKDAAERIGYSETGLRHIVDRTRRKSLGDAVSGPTIKFMQAGKNSTILFKQEWLDEFIDLHTVDPSAAEPVRTPARKPRGTATPRPPFSFGLDPRLWS